MGERWGRALPSLSGKVGFLAGAMLAVALVSEVGGVAWWAARPLWFHLLPLVAIPLIGFVIGFSIGKRLAGDDLPTEQEGLQPDGNE